MDSVLADDAYWAAQTTAEGPHAGKAWWGWGYVSELRKEVEARYADHIGEKFLRPMTVAEAGARLPPVRVDIAAWPPSVARLCTTAPFERLLHSRGRDFVDVLRNLRGDFSDAHDVVAYPEAEADVVALLKECAQRRVAVVPFGGGSSVVGGVAPCLAPDHVGSLALDLAKMNRLLEVDTASQTARAQGGIYGPALEAALRPSGLTLRYYPQSFEFSTVGGWLATRGGGHFATGPTHVDDLTQSLRVVTPAGVTENRALPGSGAGPAEHRLYLGSEGSLGVITEACVRLRRRPQARASATVGLAGFDADEAFARGAAAVRALAQTGLQPANLRLVYGPEIARAAGAGLNESQRQMLASGAMLLISFEAPTAGARSEASLDAQLEALLEIATSAEHGGVVISKKVASGTKTDTGERDGIAGSWGQAFMRGGYVSAAACLLPSTLVNTFETACTWASFPTLHRAVLVETRAAIRRVCGVDGQVTCRFTHVYPDGPAPYYTVVVRGLAQTELGPGREDPRIEMWLEIKRCAMGVIMANGGTSTHHHAVGRLHQPHYELERGALMGTALQAAKAALDPDGIMNPGMLIGELPAKL